MTSSLEMCETCKWLDGIACRHPDLDKMPYEKGCSYWESPGKLTAEEIKRGILSKPSTRLVPRERKIVQITGNSEGLWALCDDGSLWLLRANQWDEMPPIPLACDEGEA